MAISVSGRSKSATACFIIAVICCLVACQSPSKAVGKTIFYQPLVQDASVTLKQWQQLFELAAAQGYQSLVVQWTHYDSVDFMSQNAHLHKVLQAAVQFDFTVWLGLRTESDYFEKMQQPVADRQDYFRLQLAQNQLQLSRLKAKLPFPVEKLAGWYLPLELNDSDFSVSADQTWLAKELGLFLKSVAEPVAISAFSNGQLTNHDYIQALQRIAETGLIIWFQDDAGAGFKSQDRRQALLTQLPCEHAVIAEHFRHTTGSAISFSPRRASSAEIQVSQTAIKSCHAKMVFSLRYLPIAENILNLPTH
ncbi:DUF4434 domain-containing protein [Arsukibacterium indicum]|uniref:DUF4434 domain-containing protein n=1 Tax=Arsukibacterium indicum TaxID=2848612 RepID=A0ABS6MPI1_9GAMM|nr:DUF4434 domain-containing protein [Arsukibacterium indicum]MBV2130294.1 DUF4434 domain-containing protein [Arsukibacterium indicum]